ncbi:hypothetical protein [Rhizobium multihospitium]|uniref:Uncharacterized protein n=1 Tax=Rhizobium multihospitium TaxID=410764 RepID=A0A1C3XDJ0_9HYPH|nr:hypothetical protein [Rhizobium multihospitium]SCB50333.1 hypothetical protein GA0061103_0813 [Rhizobium multihospitium]
MSDHDPASPATRPALPRDTFRSQRTGAAPHGSSAAAPVVVTPTYDDSPALTAAPAAMRSKKELSGERQREAKSRGRDHNPFEPYGERSSSRPYALRLPDPIDLVVRQMAAEQRTHPLRIVDKILFDGLKRLGRLPPPPED